MVQPMSGLIKALPLSLGRMEINLFFEIAGNPVMVNTENPAVVIPVLLINVLLFIFFNYTQRRKLHAGGPDNYRERAISYQVTQE
jgi:hypothetical protein